MNEYAKRLKAARAEANLSLNEVAKLISCNKSTIARWENGSTSPSMPVLKELARIYRVSAAYLAGWTDEKNDIPDEKAQKLNTIYNKTKNLSDGEIDSLMNYVSFLLERKGKQ